MAIIGFSRSAKMGVSAIVGLGNKADIDEDDLLAFFEQDPNVQVVAMHVEDLKDGSAFADVAQLVSKCKKDHGYRRHRGTPIVLGGPGRGSHAGSAADDAPAREGGRAARRRLPGQVRVPGEHEPRDPDPP